jgi:beta-glucosidase-like glycosyl hydrolase
LAGRAAIWQAIAAKELAEVIEPAMEPAMELVQAIGPAMESVRAIGQQAQERTE